MAIILSISDRGNGTHHVEVATADATRAGIIIPTDALLDPGLPAMLDNLASLMVVRRKVRRQPTPPPIPIPRVDDY